MYYSRSEINRLFIEVSGEISNFLQVVILLGMFTSIVSVSVDNSLTAWKHDMKGAIEPISD